MAEEIVVYRFALLSSDRLSSCDDPRLDDLKNDTYEQLTNESNSRSRLCSFRGVALFCYSSFFILAHLAGPLPSSSSFLPPLVVGSRRTVTEIISSLPGLDIFLTSVDLRVSNLGAVLNTLRLCFECYGSLASTRIHSL
mmetsp:Transcript_13898/g.19300  ORF Transcript_13898/g.19300 Transcript_13898/m.19300 type:complete len:139 (-) Transcript_13898:39-455(-)